MNNIINLSATYRSILLYEALLSVYRISRFSVLYQPITPGQPSRADYIHTS